MNKEFDLDYLNTKKLEEKIKQRNEELSKGIGQKNKMRCNRLYT